MLEDAGGTLSGKRVQYFGRDNVQWTSMPNITSVRGGAHDNGTLGEQTVGCDGPTTVGQLPGGSFTFCGKRCIPYYHSVYN